MYDFQRERNLLILELQESKPLSGYGPKRANGTHKYFVLVLCRNCFEASEHRHHQYEMLRDEGGGWCDCGDRSAWREPFVFCTFHAPKYTQPPMGAPMPPVAGRKSLITFNLQENYFLLDKK